MTVTVSDQRRSTTAPWLAAGAAAVGAIYVGWRDPARDSGFIPCPFHAVTGWWCPGCGMTRAVHHLLHLDVGAALSSNLLLPVVLLIAAWAWLGWVSPRVPRMGRVVPSWAWATLVVLAVAYAVARNLPVDALRTLAP